MIKKSLATVPLIQDLSVLGMTQMDPSTGSVVSVNIPFRHWKGFLNLLEFDSLGQLYVRVLNQLQAVTGASTSVELKVVVSLQGVEFKIPRANSNTFKNLRFDYVNALKQSGKVEQPNLNKIDSNEGIPLAPVRGLTSDPQCKQFGEYYSTFRDELKRFKLTVEDSIDIDANSQGSFFYEARTSQAAFQSVALMYSLLRAPLAFKLFAYAPNDAKYEVPIEVYLFTDMRNHAPIAYRPNVSNSTPVHKCSSAQPGEFVIPHLNHTATNLMTRSKYAGNVTTFTAQDNRVLVFVFKNINTEKITLRYQLYVAFADEAAYGVFTGYGSLQYTDSTVDEWILQGKKQSGIVDVNGALDKIIDKVLPDNLVGTMLGVLLDKPTVAIPPELVKVRKADYINHCAGPSIADKMQLYPAGQQLVDKEHFGTDGDEMNYVKMMREKRCFLNTFTWSTKDESTTKLAEFRVGPMFELFRDTEDTIVKPTLLTYLSKGKEYWRGGITFTFDIVASQFHEGKLDFSYHPNAGVVPAYEAAVSQYVTSWTIKNAHNQIAITLPYFGETPYKRVWNGVEMVEEEAATGAYRFSDYFSGTLAVWISNPLRVPTTVVPNLDINVYVQAASDYEVNSISPKNLSLWPVENNT